MNEQESIFIIGINKKQERAFCELFRRFYNYLVLFAMRRVQRQDVAEDIVLEVFENIWEGEKEFNSFIGFKTFLYNAVSNRCLDYLKHETVEQQYAAKMMKEASTSETLDLVEEEMYRELHLAINELPERIRNVFELHLEGKKYEEIANLLQLSLLTVKSYKRDAIRYLKKRLGSTYYFLIAINFIG